MKCDEHVKVHMTAELKADLKRFAKKTDRELSDYLRHVLIRHVIVEAALEKAEGAQRPN